MNELITSKMKFLFFSFLSIYKKHVLFKTKKFFKSSDPNKIIVSLKYAKYMCLMFSKKVCLI
jgi:hypothetical protein